MGMTIDEAMEEIIKIKRTKYKDDNISDFSQALSIAFLTMKNYQILKNSYIDRLKADMVAMLTEIQLEIEKEKWDTSHLDYDDLENAEHWNNGIDTCVDIVQQRIDALK